MAHVENEIPNMDLKMPQNYNFDTRKTDWSKYKPYYLLRTDAVWEKSKLYQYFYSQLKAPLYFNNNQYYLISEVWNYQRLLHKIGPPVTYDEIGESSENHKVAVLYNEAVNGGIFTQDIHSLKNTPRKTSQFLGDWGKETTLLCMIKFHKWMRCNEKSEYKLSSVNTNNPENFYKYDCFEELKELNEHCINYHFKVMFEMYYFRVYNDSMKNSSQHKVFRLQDIAKRPTSSRVLYY